MQSFRLLQDAGPVKGGATVMARFTDSNGVPLSICPRSWLQMLAERFQEKHGTSFLIGFEIEITFCKRDPSDNADPFKPLDTVHAWGTFSDEQYLHSVSLMTSIATKLQDIGIPVEHLHSEAGAGQYEFVLPPLPPIQAVDTLTQARQCIQQMAATHGLRATCHPMPFPGIGTAAHAHISLNSPTLSDSTLERNTEFVMASVLRYLPSICAMSMPQSVSYGRVVDDSWTGGTYVAWGTENREVPLRRINATRFEIRCLDGTANMYLVLCAVLSAGLDGIKDAVPFDSKDCKVNPSKLSDDERMELGVVERMPRSLKESLRELKMNIKLHGLMGDELITNWIAVKEAEQQMLEEMSESDRRIWLIERY